VDSKVKVHVDIPSKLVEWTIDNVSVAKNKLSDLGKYQIENLQFIVFSKLKITSVEVSHIKFSDTSSKEVLNKTSEDTVDN